MDKDENRVRLQKKSYEDLSEIANAMGISKKRCCELMIAVGKRMFGKTKGLITLLLDPSLRIKLLFDEESRKEIEF
jgi:hypothetical protein